MDEATKEYKEEMKEMYSATLRIMEKRYDWLRTIVTMAAGVIGVVVALRSGRLEAWIEYLLFGAAIILLCAGVVVGCVALYGEHRALVHIQKGILENRLAKLDPSYVRETLEFKPIWRRLEWATLILLLAGILALIGFALVASSPACGA